MRLSKKTFILHFRLFKATFFLRMGKDFPPIWDRFLKAEMEGSPILFASTKLAFNMYILILKMFYGKHHAAEEFGIRLSNTTEKFENSLKKMKIFQWFFNFFSEFSNYSVVFESQIPNLRSVMFAVNTMTQAASKLAKRYDLQFRK